MRPQFLILLACLICAPLTAIAQDASDSDVAVEEAAVDPLAPRSAEALTLEEFQWLARPVVVFADIGN